MSAGVGTLVPPFEGVSDIDSLYEIVNGERVEIPRMGVYAGILASFLVTRLNAAALPQKLGVGVVEVLFRMVANRPARRPDVAFVRSDRWPEWELLAEDPAELDLVPNLAVEVNSPTNYGEDTLLKVQEYFDAGVQLVWIVYPRLRCIYVYESPTSVRVLTEKDELDAGTVLPGFRLSIADLYAPFTPPV